MRSYTSWLFTATFFLLIGTAFIPTRNLVAPNWSASVADTKAPTANDYSVIDTYASRTPETYARNLKTLATYLTSPARSETAKARSIYAWILSHIRYDGSIYSGQVYYSEIDYATKVLRSRRAVCTGFALLYKQLLKQAGVTVENVKGYSRVNDAQAGLPIQRMDHEWNAVRLDGDWYLLDLTWAATTGHNGQFNDHYFLTDPAEFISQHYPYDPKWQLLNPQVSKADFDRYPKINDAYFRLGFGPDFPTRGLLRANGSITLSFYNEQSVEFTCSLGRPRGIIANQPSVSVQRSGAKYQLTIPIPDSGTYSLYVLAKPKGGSVEHVRSYEGIATFTVVAN